MKTDQQVLEQWITNEIDMDVGLSKLKMTRLGLELLAEAIHKCDQTLAFDVTNDDGWPIPIRDCTDMKVFNRLASTVFVSPEAKRVLSARWLAKFESLKEALYELFVVAGGEVA